MNNEVPGAVVWVLAITSLATVALVAHRYLRSALLANSTVALMGAVALIVAERLYSGYVSGWTLIGAAGAAAVSLIVALLIGGVMDGRAISARRRQVGPGA